MPISTILIGVAVALLLLLIVISYVKAPPDMAFIISGLKRRIVIGSANIRIPFLERLDKGIAESYTKVVDAAKRPSIGQ